MSDTYQGMVSEFHRLMEIDEATQPTPLDARTRDLRIALMREEFGEVIDALHGTDVKQIAKELADLLYVVFGTANVCGLDMAEVFLAVHLSNLSKRGADGRIHRRADGKVIKPPTYQAADLSFLDVAPIDDKQLELDCV
jgi:predicted HAD superfamily Cof-like phosphohydrolase